MSEEAGRPQTKIRIPLRGAALDSGYESESVWAESLGGGLYKVWNVPAFSYNVEMTDIVECSEASDDLPLLARVVGRGTCYGVRLYFAETASDDAMAEVLVTVSARRPVIMKCRKRLWTLGFRSFEDYQWLGSAVESYLVSGLISLGSVGPPDVPGW